MLTWSTFTPTLLATIVRITACKNFSCHKSESGIVRMVRLTNDTINIVMAHAILVDTLKFRCKSKFVQLGIRDKHFMKLLLMSP